MNEFEQLRADVLTAYLRLVAAIGPRLSPTRRRLIEERRDKLAAGRYYVVVCGEFRRGKSSLLNALVERPGLFPVDVDITTCAVVTLQWGGQDSATVIFAAADPDDPASAKPPAPIDIGDVARFATEQANPDNAQKVLRIDMAAPVPQLQSGLVLVDTPGLGSANPAHTAMTRAYLPNADAILFVAAANEPLSVPELGFLRLALAQCPVVVAAVTMIDKVVNPAPVVAEARSRIAEAAGTDPRDLVLVPVSSAQKRRARKDDDPALLASSGFPELEAELWGGLATTCGAAQVTLALGEWDTALAEARAPLDNNLAALRGDAAKTAAGLRDLQDRHRTLTADSHSWRRDLRGEIDRAAQPIQARLEGELDQIRADFGTALHADDAVARASAIVDDAMNAMVTAAASANQELEADMSRIASKYSALTDLPLTVAAPAGEVEPAPRPQAPKVTTKPQAYTKFREMWLGASAGAAAGGLIGSVGGIVGAAVGSVVGFVVGLFGGRAHQKRTAQEQQRRSYIADLRDNVLPALEAGRRRITRDVSRQVANYAQDLTRELEDEVRAKGESLAQSIRLLEETQRQGARARADTERELVAQLREIDALAAELDALRARTQALSRERSGRPGQP
jgi:hypothetical protein